MSYHVLIVDDDPAICKLLSKVMISNEMDPLVVNSGAAALDLIARQSSTLDMILMDITLGDMEGFDVIQTIRRNGVTTPVIIISGRNEDYDFMYGLSLGADDYVTKPFSPAELTARVDALMRRSGVADEVADQIDQPPFLLNTRNRTLEKNGRRIKLTQMEYAIMKMFMENPGKALSREEILDLVWGRDYFGELKIVDVNIRRLRLKIEDNATNPTYITTVWGYGYKWEA